MLAFTVGGADLSDDAGRGACARGGRPHAEQGQGPRPSKRWARPGAGAAPGPASPISSITRSRSRRRGVLEAASSTSKPPFINFYRAAMRRSTERARPAAGQRFAALFGPPSSSRSSISCARTDRRLAGAPAGLVYFCCQRRRRCRLRHHGGLRASASPTWRTYVPDKRW